MKLVWYDDLPQHMKDTHSVHLLHAVTTFAYFLWRGLDRDDAMKRTVEVTGIPSTEIWKVAMQIDQIVIPAAKWCYRESDPKEIDTFGRTVPLADVVTMCPVTRELYGRKVYNIDEAKLARLFLDEGFGNGFDEVKHIVEQRLENLTDRLD